jgi:imidazolonepropionase-like amidohydrolase
LSPADAIVAGTRTAAELLGLADELGTVQAGKIADLIVCAGDPLADITLLGKPENVVAVVQAGVVRKNTMQARGWHNAMSARQAGASAASHTNSTRTRQ